MNSSYSGGHRRLVGMFGAKLALRFALPTAFLIWLASYPRILITTLSQPSYHLTRTSSQYRLPRFVSPFLFNDNFVIQ